MVSPRRIVVLAPGLSDILLALGVRERIVGASDNCELPPGDEVLRLGGTGNPDVAQIQALHPDLVLVERGEASAALAPALAAAGLPVVSAGARTVSEAIELVDELAWMLGEPAAGVELTNAMRAAWMRAEARLGQRAPRRTVAFTWRDPWLAVGAESYAADLLRLAGALNVALHLPGRNPRAALDRFLSFNPQVILLARGPFPFAPEDLGVLWRFSDVDAVKSGRVHLIESRLLTRIGSHMADALDQLSELIGRD